MKIFLTIIAIPLLFFKSLFSVELNDILPEPYPQVYNIEVLPFDPHHWYAHHHIFQSAYPSK